MAVTLINQTKAKLPLSRQKLNLALAATFKILGKKTDQLVSVIIVSPSKIRALNRRYRRCDKVTDVLSFSYSQDNNDGLDQQQNYLGEIFLCPSRIKSQARELNQPLVREYLLLTIHGCLHLLGYLDETHKQYQKMAKIQNQVLHKIYDQNKKIN